MMDMADKIVERVPRTPPRHLRPALVRAAFAISTLLPLIGGAVGCSKAPNPVSSPSPPPPVSTKAAKAVLAQLYKGEMVRVGPFEFTNMSDFGSNPDTLMIRDTASGSVPFVRSMSYSNGSLYDSTIVRSRGGVEIPVTYSIRADMYSLFGHQDAFSFYPREAKDSVQALRANLVYGRVKLGTFLIFMEYNQKYRDHYLNITDGVITFGFLVEVGKPISPGYGLYGGEKLTILPLSISDDMVTMTLTLAP